jgi:hypothetical protein
MKTTKKQWIRWVWNGFERAFIGPEESGPWMKTQFDLFKKAATKMGIQPQ